jgi:hypothetical protein
MSRNSSLDVSCTLNAGADGQVVVAGGGDGGGGELCAATRAAHALSASSPTHAARALEIAIARG